MEVDIKIGPKMRVSVKQFKQRTRKDSFFFSVSLLVSLCLTAT